MRHPDPGCDMLTAADSFSTMNVMASLMRLKDIMPAQEGIPKGCWQIRSTGRGKTGRTVRRTGYGCPVLRLADPDR